MTTLSKHVPPINGIKIQQLVDAVKRDFQEIPNFHAAEAIKTDIRKMDVLESDMSDGGGMASIAPVYTGSAADYDAPSLHYIGSGEGAQVYGWGLYGSSSENVARWYAEADAERKNRKNRKQHYLVYKISDHGVTYTLVTRNDGDFRSFYSDKRTTPAVTASEDASAARVSSQYNVTPNSEKSSGESEIIEKIRKKGRKTEERREFFSMSTRFLPRRK